MRSRILISFVVLFLLVSSSPLAAQQWRRGVADRFVIITDEKEREARDALLRLHQMRVVFEDVFHKSRVGLPSRTELILVRDPQNFSAVAPWWGNTFSGPQMFTGLERSFVVMRATDSWEKAQRSVVRMLLETNYPHTPAWFDSGMARYLAAAKFVSDALELGRAPEDDRSGQWIPIENILSAHGESDDPQWQHESWLLVHWIMANQRLSDAARYFQLTMARGESAQQALREAFGADIDEFDKTLRAYEGTGGRQTKRYARKADTLPASFLLQKITPVDAQAFMANASLDSPMRKAAFERLNTIMKDNPTNLETRQALTYAYMLSGDQALAMENARTAIRIDPNSDAATQYYFAVLNNDGKTEEITVPSAEVRLGNLVSATMHIDAEFAPALDLLGLVHLNSGRTREAVQSISGATAVRPRNDLYLLHLGMAKDVDGDSESAKAIFTMLRQSQTKTIAERATQSLSRVGQKPAQESALLRQYSSGYVDPTDPRWKPKSGATPVGEKEAQEAAPDTRKTEHLEGMLESVSCGDDPGAELTVASRGKRWRLKVADRKSVLLVGPYESFSCGWKKLTVSINYKPSGTMSGDVVSITAR